MVEQLTMWANPLPPLPQFGENHLGSGVTNGLLNFPKGGQVLKALPIPVLQVILTLKYSSAFHDGALI